MRLREVKSLVQGHTAYKWLNQNWKHVFPASDEIHTGVDEAQRRKYYYYLCPVL
jgi:hypothetical protein